MGAVDGEALPVTHFLRLVLGVMLNGAAPADVGHQFAARALMVGVLALAALSRFKRTLD